MRKVNRKGGSFMLLTSLLSLMALTDVQAKGTGLYTETREVVTEITLQNGKVVGVVLDNLGMTLPGAVVRVLETKQAATANLDGEFSIDLNANLSEVTIDVSFLGFDSQQVKVKAGEPTAIKLLESNNVLKEVVVTALGIKREEKKLGYSQQTLTSEDIDNAQVNNWSESMKGKVAGLSMISSNSGPMNSAQIKLRGDRSLDLSQNAALVVVDGVILNSDLWTSGSNDAYNTGTGSPIDYGNGIADLNPDDIASITVLKGPGAAALYGSRAANGVLMVTTKAGKKDKGLGISFNSSVTFDVIQNWPDYQYEYGQGGGKSFDAEGNPYYSYRLSEDGGSTGSTSSAFGPKFDGQYYFQYDPTTEAMGAERTLWRPYKNNIKDFWRTGMTTTNSLALSGGNEKGNIRASITRADNEWIMPNTGFERTTIATKASYQVSRSVKLNSSVSYTNRKSDNLPNTGYGNNTISYFMIFQNPNVDLDWYRPIWQNDYQKVKQIHPFSSYIDNPYLIAYEMLNPVNTNTITGNLSTDITITPKLKLMVRAALNSRVDKREQKRPYSANKYAEGYYRIQDINFKEINTDFLLTYTNNDSQVWNYSASLGGNMLDSKYHSATSSVTGLMTPDVYMLANGKSPAITTIVDTNYKVNSLYGMASVGFKNKVFVDATLRNDWSSTLPKDSWSFIYPSVNTSFLVSDIFNFPAAIDMTKVRFSFAEVGNGTRPYQTLKYYSNSTFASSATAPTTLHNGDLVPEKTKSFEVGLEHKMFRNRLSFDVTLYQSKTKNQILTVPLNYATGYNKAVINGGDIQNRGIEVMLSATPVKTKNFSWTSTVNWAKNENKILSLAEEFEGGDQQVLANAGTVSIIGKVGGSTGDMYGYKFVRNDEGQIIYNDKGLPVQAKAEEYLGSAYADWTMGWTNVFKYKGFKFSVTLDGQYGGKIYSQTHHKMSEQGKLGHTLMGREDGFIIGDGVVEQKDGSFLANTTKVNPADYYKEYYRRANVESNSFDASFLKVREVSLEYSFPKTVLERLKVNRLTLSVYGRNLFTASDFPIFDPETAALNGGSMVPGVEMGQMPSPASYGFNLKIEI